MMLKHILQRHIISSMGEEGITALDNKAQKWITPLSDVWDNRHTDDGLAQLMDILGESILDIDSLDLRPKPVPLRIYGPSIGIYCKLIRSFFDFISANDIASQTEILQRISSHRSKIIKKTENVLGLLRGGAAAALAEIYLEYDSLDFYLIESLLLETLSRSKCSYSEILLRKVILKKKKSASYLSNTMISILDLKDKFCPKPFSRLATLPPYTLPPFQKGITPETFACSCPGMLPYPLNPCGEQRSPDQIWNGPEAQEIRRSIHDGDFTYCSAMLCSYIVKGSLPLKSDIQDPALRDIIDNRKLVLDNAPTDITLAHDISCNISCPSCRNEILTAKGEEQKIYDDFVARTILPLIDGSRTYLHVSGDGDPIGSRHYRKMLHSLDPIIHSNLCVALHSNGLLLTEQEWNRLAPVHGLIKYVSISIDAAQKDTYEYLRRPGKWETLTRNMEFLASLRLQGKLDFLSIQFVVQQKNFKEIPAFIELGRHWNVDKVYFSRLFPVIHQVSLTEGQIEYKKNAICEMWHPQHAELLKVLENPLLQLEMVDMFNLAQLSDYNNDLGPAEELMRL